MVLVVGFVPLCRGWISVDGTGSVIWPPVLSTRMWCSSTRGSGGEATSRITLAWVGLCLRGREELSQGHTYERLGYLLRR